MSKLISDVVTAEKQLTEILRLKLGYKDIYAHIIGDKIYIQFTLRSSCLALYEDFALTDSVINKFCNHLKSWEIPYSQDMSYYKIDTCYFESLYCLFRFTI